MLDFFSSGKCLEEWFGAEMPVKGTFLLKVFSKNRKHTIISKLIILPFEVIFINMKDDKHIKKYFHTMIH